jgi:hypothetical protein
MDAKRVQTAADNQGRRDCYLRLPQHVLDMCRRPERRTAAFAGSTKPDDVRGFLHAALVHLEYSLDAVSAAH